MALSSRANGTLVETFVREGDDVQAGQLLATVDNFDLQRERIQLRRDIEVAQTNLRIRVLEAKNWDRDAISNRANKQVEYFRLLGEYQDGKSRLESLHTLYQVNAQLHQSEAVPHSDYVAAKSAYEGQKALLENLASAIDTLKESLDLLDSNPLSELAPAEAAKLRSVEQELSQIDQLLKAGEVRAPFAGKILRVLKHLGEFAAQSDSVIELLERVPLKQFFSCRKIMPQKSFWVSNWFGHQASGRDVGLSGREDCTPLNAAPRFGKKPLSILLESGCGPCQTVGPVRVRQISFVDRSRSGVASMALRWLTGTGGTFGGASGIDRI